MYTVTDGVLGVVTIVNHMSTKHMIHTLDIVALTVMQNILS